MKMVSLFLAKGFEAYEASVFTDVLGWSKAFGDIPVEVTTTGRYRKLKCTWNFTVIPEIQIDEVNTKDYDALAIPGGFEKAGFYEDAYHEDFLILNGMRRKQLAEFGADVLDRHVVVDGNIITSSSPATALDVAIKLLEMLTSKKNCEKVKKWMGF